MSKITVLVTPGPSGLRHRLVARGAVHHSPYPRHVWGSKKRASRIARRWKRLIERREAAGASSWTVE